jgi:hypothetical protein
MYAHRYYMINVTLNTINELALHPIHFKPFGKDASATYMSSTGPPSTYIFERWHCTHKGHEASG